MANGTRTKEVVAGSAGFFAGALAGGLLGRSGFFGSSKDENNVLTPGGAKSADAVATSQAGVQADAPNPSSAILPPNTVNTLIAKAKANPLITVAVIAVVVLLLIRR